MEDNPLPVEVCALIRSFVTDLGTFQSICLVDSHFLPSKSEVRRLKKQFATTVENLIPVNKTGDIFFVNGQPVFRNEVFQRLPNGTRHGFYSLSVCYGFDRCKKVFVEKSGKYKNGKKVGIW